MNFKFFRIFHFLSILTTGNAAGGGLLSNDLVCLNPIQSDYGERVVGGVDAGINTWKWIVKIDIGCGGSIIHPNWILTAGHCCFSKNVQYYRFHYKPRIVSLWKFSVV